MFKMLLLSLCFIALSIAHKSKNSHHERHEHRHHHHHHKCTQGKDETAAHKVTKNALKYRNHPYEQNNDGLSRRRLQLTDAQTDPIRISVYYDPVTISEAAGLTSTQIDYIKEITAAAVRFYEKWVQVIPVVDPLEYWSCDTWFGDQFGAGDIQCLLYDLTCGQVIVPEEHMDQRLGLSYTSQNDPNPTTIFEPGPGIFVIYNL